jgi:hypothetical protein
LKSSETADAADASAPDIVPDLGAESGIVKTIGSGVEGDPGTGLLGVMRDEVGKRI